MQDMDTSLPCSSVVPSPTELSYEQELPAVENIHKKARIRISQLPYEYIFRYYPRNTFIGTMTMYLSPPEMQSVGIQCDLLAVPPLKKLSSTQEETDHLSDTDDAADLTDLDTSYQISQEENTTE